MTVGAQQRSAFARVIFSELADAVRRDLAAKSADRADERHEARELLEYWERRARELPRWAFTRRREARELAGRWRERVGGYERERYGSGIVGAASQYAVERRVPAALAHRRRQAARLALWTAAATVAAIVLVLVAVLVTVLSIVVDAL